eukprot:SAG11_NODE_24233_length_376_cov_1.104693_1_plen_71_part_00
MYTGAQPSGMYDGAPVEGVGHFLGPGQSAAEPQLGSGLTATPADHPLQMPRQPAQAGSFLSLVKLPQQPA